MGPRGRGLAPTAGLGEGFTGRRVLGFGQREESLNFHFTLSPCVLPIDVRALRPRWGKSDFVRILGREASARPLLGSGGWVGMGDPQPVWVPVVVWGESPRFLFWRSQAGVSWLPRAGLCTHPASQRGSKRLIPSSYGEKHLMGSCSRPPGSLRSPALLRHSLFPRSAIVS